MKSILLKFFAAICASLFVLSTAAATVVYTNGALNVNGGSAINSGFVLTNSFALGTDADITSLDIALQTLAVNTPLSVQWSFGTSAFGSDVSSGTSLLTDLQFQVNGFEMYQANLSFDGPLTAGNYWFTLENAVGAHGDAIYLKSSSTTQSAFSKDTWSPGFPTIARSAGYFVLSNDEVTVPEPGTLALLSLGLFGFAASRRRKQ